MWFSAQSLCDSQVVACVFWWLVCDMHITVLNKDTDSGGAKSAMEMQFTQPPLTAFSTADSKHYTSPLLPSTPVYYSMSRWVVCATHGASRRMYCAPARMAVMNVGDKLAAQSPRQLHMHRRVPRASYTLILSAFHTSPSPAIKHKHYRASFYWIKMPWVDSPPPPTPLVHGPRWDGQSVCLFVWWRANT